MEGANTRSVVVDSQTGHGHSGQDILSKLLCNFSCDFKEEIVARLDREGEWAKHDQCRDRDRGDEDCLWEVGSSNPHRH